MLPVVHQVSGAILVVAGLIVLPLPIPFGLIMMVIGFSLLAPYIPVIQRLIRKMRSRWPNLNMQLLRHHHRFPPIIKKTIDKTHPVSPAE